MKTYKIIALNSNEFIGKVEVNSASNIVKIKVAPISKNKYRSVLVKAIESAKRHTNSHNLAIKVGFYEIFIENSNSDFWQVFKESMLLNLNILIDKVG